MNSDELTTKYFNNYSLTRLYSSLKFVSKKKNTNKIPLATISKIKIKLVYSKIKWASWNYKLDLIALLSNLKSVGCICRVVFVFRWLNNNNWLFCIATPTPTFFLYSYFFLWFRSNLYIYSSKYLWFSWLFFLRSFDIFLARKTSNKFPGK